MSTDADAWDAVHEVFARLAGAADLLRVARERPMAYVYRATTNACLNILEARQVRARPLPMSSTASPEAFEVVHARDLLEKLDKHLDPIDRQILILWFNDGLPQEQIAEVLGIWRRTVGRRLARLRKLIEELQQLPLKKTS